MTTLILRQYSDGQVAILNSNGRTLGTIAAVEHAVALLQRLNARRLDGRVWSADFVGGTWIVCPR